MRLLTFSLFLLVVTQQVFSQKEKLNRIVAGFPVNYEDDSVPPYTLPDLFSLKNGKKVKDAADWMQKKRPEILKAFEMNQFGEMPGRPKELHFNIFDKGTPAFDGAAIRKQVTVYFTKDTSRLKMDLLIYLPVAATQPVPLLLMINFSHNSNAVDDPGIKQGMVWSKEGQLVPAIASGRSFGKIDVKSFVTAGFGVATLYYGDIEPDFKTGLPYGIRGYYLKPTQTKIAPNQWGAISAWAWGLSRAMDYFETDPQVDAKRIALEGASRLGKTVLWAGAHDTRFKMVIASCSGEGGAALSRRDYGENIKHMSDTSRYFYQFAPQWHEYAGDFNASPVDAHMLISLMAPRPLLLQTGDTDYWSDPKGEFLAAVAATPVYNLLGAEGLTSLQWTAPGDRSQLNTLGYFMHAGGHTTIPSDWPIFIEYMKKYL
jgi:hypothetical protein